MFRFQTIQDFLRIQELLINEFRYIYKIDSRDKLFTNKLCWFSNPKSSTLTWKTNSKLIALEEPTNQVYLLH